MQQLLYLIAPLIESRLGKYLEGDLAKDLKLTRSGVEFAAANLRLKDGALDELGLPVALKRGFLRSLEMKISFSLAVDIKADGLFLLVYPPHSSAHFDVEAYQRQKEAMKLRSLEAVESRMLETQWKFVTETQTWAQQFLESLKKHFVTNVQISVTNVHLRYQDTTTVPSQPFSAGVTLKKLIAINVTQAELTAAAQARKKKESIGRHSRTLSRLSDSDGDSQGSDRRDGDIPMESESEAMDSDGDSSGEGDESETTGKPRKRKATGIRWTDDAANESSSGEDTILSQTRKRVAKRLFSEHPKDTARGRTAVGEDGGYSAAEEKAGGETEDGESEEIAMEGADDEADTDIEDEGTGATSIGSAAGSSSSASSSKSSLKGTGADPSSSSVSETQRPSLAEIEEMQTTSIAKKMTFEDLSVYMNVTTPQTARTMAEPGAFQRGFSADLKKDPSSKQESLMKMKKSVGGSEKCEDEEGRVVKKAAIGESSKKEEKKEDIMDEEDDDDEPGSEKKEADPVKSEDDKKADEWMDRIIWNEELLSDGALISMFGRIPTSEKRFCHHYDFVLSPMSLEFIISLNTDVHSIIHKYPDTPSKWPSRTECNLSIAKLQFTVSKRQLNTIQAWGQAWKFVNARIQLERVLLETSKLRPKNSAGSFSKDASIEEKRQSGVDWWKYTTQCIVSLQRKARNVDDASTKFNFAFLESFSERRRRYSELYKRKLRPAVHKTWMPELNDKEKSELLKFEKSCPLDQILLFRSIAMAELKAQLDKRKEVLARKKREHEEKMKDSYTVTKWFARAARDYVMTQEEFPKEYQLSTKEKLTVVRNLNFTRTMNEMKLPDGYIEHRFSLALSSASLDLVDNFARLSDEHQVGVGSPASVIKTLRFTQDGQRIASVVVCKMTLSTRVQIQVRPRSNLIGVGVQKIEVRPGNSGGNLFSTMFTPKTATKRRASFRFGPSSSPRRAHSYGGRTPQMMGGGSMFGSVIARRTLMLHKRRGSTFVGGRMGSTPGEMLSGLGGTGSSSSSRRMSTRHSLIGASTMLGSKMSTVGPDDFDSVSGNAESPFTTKDLIQVEIETHPAHSSADSRVVITVAPIQLVWDLDWLKQMQAFFHINKAESLSLMRKSSKIGVGGTKTPSSHAATPVHSSTASTSVDSMSLTAEDVTRRVEQVSWQQKGQRQLLGALATNGKVEMSVEVKGGLLLIPEDCSNPNSRVLVAEMSDFAVRNELPLRMASANGNITRASRTSSVTMSERRSPDPSSRMEIQVSPMSGFGRGREMGSPLPPLLLPDSMTLQTPARSMGDSAGELSGGEPSPSASPSLTPLAYGHFSDVESDSAMAKFAAEDHFMVTRSGSRPASSASASASGLLTRKHRSNTLPASADHLTVTPNRHSRRPSISYKSRIQNKKKPATLVSEFEPVRTNPQKYDTFFIRQSNTVLLLFDKLSDFLEKSSAASFQTIIDSFSYDVTLHSLQDALADDLPDLFVAGKLPKLHIRFTTSAFYTICEVGAGVMELNEQIKENKQREAEVLAELDRQEEVSVSRKLSSTPRSSNKAPMKATKEKTMDDDQSGSLTVADSSVAVTIPASIVSQATKQLLTLTAQSSSEDMMTPVPTSFALGVDPSTKEPSLSPFGDEMDEMLDQAMDLHPKVKSAPSSELLLSDPLNTNNDTLETSVSGSGHSRRLSSTVSDAALAELIEMEEQIEEERAFAADSGFDEKHVVLKFEMKKFSLKLSDDHTDRNSDRYYRQHLIQFEVNSLNGFVERRLKIMTMHASLGSMFLKDLFQNSGRDFDYLVTSKVSPDILAAATPIASKAHSRMSTGVTPTVTGSLGVSPAARGVSGQATATDSSHLAWFNYNSDVTSSEVASSSRSMESPWTTIPHSTRMGPDLISVAATNDVRRGNWSMQCEFNALHIGWNPETALALNKFAERIQGIQEDLLTFVDVNDDEFEDSDEGPDGEIVLGAVPTVDGITDPVLTKIRESFTVDTEDEDTITKKESLEMPMTEKTSESKSAEKDESVLLAPTTIDLTVRMRFLGLTLNTNVVDAESDGSDENKAKKKVRDVSDTLRAKSAATDSSVTAALQRNETIWRRPSRYRYFARICNRNTNMSVSMYRSGKIHASGELGNLSIDDLRPDTMYPKILSVKDGTDFEVGKFDLTMYDHTSDHPDSEEFPDYYAGFRFEMNSIKVVYMHPFFQELQQYIFQSVINCLVIPDPNAINASMSDTGSSIDDDDDDEHPVFAQPSLNSSKDSPSVNRQRSAFLTESRLTRMKRDWTMLDIKTSNPLIVIPRHYNTPEYLKLDLGVVTIENECHWEHRADGRRPIDIPKRPGDGEIQIPSVDDVCDTITIRTPNARLDCNEHEIATDTELLFRLSRKLNYLSCHQPDMSVYVEMPTLKGVFRHKQYVLLMNAIGQNLGQLPMMPSDPLARPFLHTDGFIDNFQPGTDIAVTPDTFGIIREEMALEKALTPPPSPPATKSVSPASSPPKSSSSIAKKSAASKPEDGFVLTTSAEKLTRVKEDEMRTEEGAIDTEGAPPLKHANQDVNEEMVYTSAFKFVAKSALVTLGHDLQYGRETERKLACLEITDFVLTNENFRNNESLFVIKCGGIQARDSRNLPGQKFDKIICRFQDLFDHSIAAKPPRVKPLGKSRKRGGLKSGSAFSSSSSSKAASFEMIWKTSEFLKIHEKLKNKDGSFKIINSKRKQDMTITLSDPCSFAMGSIFRHLYDFFLTVDNPFNDEFPLLKRNPLTGGVAKKSQSTLRLNAMAVSEPIPADPLSPAASSGSSSKSGSSNNVSDEEGLEDDRIKEEIVYHTFDLDVFDMEFNLTNAKIVLLEDLQKRDCNALVTQGDILFTYSTETTAEKDKSTQRVTLPNFEMYFAQGNNLGSFGSAAEQPSSFADDSASISSSGSSRKRVTVKSATGAHAKGFGQEEMDAYLIQPSEFSFVSKWRKDFRLNGSEIFTTNVSMDQIVLRDITSIRAAALKNMVGSFVDNWNINGYELCVIDPEMDESFVDGYKPLSYDATASSKPSTVETPVMETPVVSDLHSKGSEFPSVKSSDATKPPSENPRFKHGMLSHVSEEGVDEDDAADADDDDGDRSRITVSGMDPLLPSISLPLDSTLSESTIASVTVPRGLSVVTADEDGTQLRSMISEEALQRQITPYEEESSLAAAVVSSAVSLKMDRSDEKSDSVGSVTQKSGKTLSKDDESKKKGSVNTTTKRHNKAPKITSRWELKIDKLEVYFHDENLAKVPPILMFGFKDLIVKGESKKPKTQTIVASMIWHASKYDDNMALTFSPLCCPWKCSVKCIQKVNPENELFVESLYPIDAFVSDTLLNRLLNNVPHWADAFAAKSDANNNSKDGVKKSDHLKPVPSLGAADTKSDTLGMTLSQGRTTAMYQPVHTPTVAASKRASGSHDRSTLHMKQTHSDPALSRFGKPSEMIGSVADSGGTTAEEKMSEHYHGSSFSLIHHLRLNFVVPKFSLYFERPSVNLTICKLYATNFEAIYASDTEKDGLQLKVGYLGVEDFIQQGGLDFRMLLETEHSKRKEFMSMLFVTYQEEYLDYLASQHSHQKQSRLLVKQDSSSSLRGLSGGGTPRILTGSAVKQFVREKQKCEIKFDTLTVNYNPETLLHIAKFFESSSSAMAAIGNNNNNNNNNGGANQTSVGQGSSGIRTASPMISDSLPILSNDEDDVEIPPMDSLTAAVAEPSPMLTPKPFESEKMVDKPKPLTEFSRSTPILLKPDMPTVHKSVDSYLTFGEDGDLDLGKDVRESDDADADRDEDEGEGPDSLLSQERRIRKEHAAVIGTVSNPVVLKVRFDLSKLNIRLNKPHLGRQVVELSLKTTSFIYRLSQNDSYRFEGSIGNLVALDLTNDVLLNSRGQKIGPRRTSASRDRSSKGHRRRGASSASFSASRSSSESGTVQSMSSTGVFPSAIFTPSPAGEKGLHPQILGLTKSSAKTLLKFRYDVNALKPLDADDLLSFPITNGLSPSSSSSAAVPLESMITSDVATKSMFATDLSVSLSSIKLTYDQVYFMEIIDYIYSGVLGLFYAEPDDDPNAVDEPVTIGGVPIPSGSLASQPHPKTHEPGESSMSIDGASLASAVWSGKSGGRPTHSARSTATGGHASMTTVSTIGSMASIVDAAHQEELDELIATAMKYKINISEPVLVLPFSRGNESSLDLNLGSIEVTNELRVNDEGIFVEDIIVKASGVNMSGSSQRQVSMAEVSLDVCVTRGMSWTRILEPNYDINVGIGKFKISMTQKHYIDILSVLWGNIWAPYPKPKSNAATPTAAPLPHFATEEAKRLAIYTHRSGRAKLEQAVNEINELILRQSLARLEKKTDERLEEKMSESAAVMQAMTDDWRRTGQTTATLKSPGKSPSAHSSASVSPSSSSKLGEPVRLEHQPSMKSVDIINAELKRHHRLVSELMVLRIQYQQILCAYEETEDLIKRMRQRQDTMRDIRSQRGQTVGERTEHFRFKSESSDSGFTAKLDKVRSYRGLTGLGPTFDFDQGYPKMPTATSVGSSGSVTGDSRTRGSSTERTTIAGLISAGSITSFPTVPEDTADDEATAHGRSDSVLSSEGAGKRQYSSASQFLAPPATSTADRSDRSPMKNERLINFAYDEEQTEYSTMRLEFKLDNLELSLGHSASSPFCTFEIEKLTSIYTCQHNGDTDTSLKIGAIRLSRVSRSRHKPHAWPKMICPFDEMRSSLKVVEHHSMDAPKVSRMKRSRRKHTHKRAASQLPTMKIGLKHTRSASDALELLDRRSLMEEGKEDPTGGLVNRSATMTTTTTTTKSMIEEHSVPEFELHMSASMDGKSRTKMVITEPCGFVLPSLLKQLQVFFDVNPSEYQVFETALPEASNYEIDLDYIDEDHSLGDNNSLLGDADAMSAAEGFTLGGRGSAAAQSGGASASAAQRGGGNSPNELAIKWNSELLIDIKNANIVCLENPSDFQTNAVVLCCSATINQTSLSSVEAENRLAVDDDLRVDVSSFSAQVRPAQSQVVVPVMAGSRPRSAADDSGSPRPPRSPRSPRTDGKTLMSRAGAATIHILVGDTSFDASVVTKETYTLDKKTCFETNMAIQAVLPKLEIYVSFIDLQIFQRMADVIQETFNPEIKITLTEKIPSLVPREFGLKDIYTDLCGYYKPELVLESLMYAASLPRKTRTLKLQGRESWKKIQRPLTVGGIPSISEVVGRPSRVISSDLESLMTGPIRPSGFGLAVISSAPGTGSSEADRFKALHYHARKYCEANEQAYAVRVERGEIKGISDLLPPWMYHNYRELIIASVGHAEADIIRALIVAKNNIDTARLILARLRSNPGIRDLTAFYSVDEDDDENEEKKALDALLTQAERAEIDEMFGSSDDPITRGKSSLTSTVAPDYTAAADVKKKRAKKLRSKTVGDTGLSSHHSSSASSSSDEDDVEACALSDQVTSVKKKLKKGRDKLKMTGQSTGIISKKKTEHSLDEGSLSSEMKNTLLLDQIAGTSRQETILGHTHHIEVLRGDPGTISASPSFRETNPKDALKRYKSMAMVRQDSYDGGDPTIGVTKFNPAVQAPTQTYVIKKFTFWASEISMAIINDVMSASAMPFVGFNAREIDIGARMEDETMSGNINLLLDSNSYNPLVVTMEPLLEKCKLTLVVSSEPTTTALKTHYAPKLRVNATMIGLPARSVAPGGFMVDLLSGGTGMDEMDDSGEILRTDTTSAADPSMAMHKYLAEKPPVNINVTHIFMKTLMDTLYASQRFRGSSKNRIIDSWKPFYIVNRTGEPLTIWPYKETSRKQRVPIGEVRPLDIPGGLKSAFSGKLIRYNRLKVSFEIGDVATFLKMEVNAKKRKKYSHKARDVSIVLQTIFKQGSKYVYIWSPCEIRNHSNHPLRLMVTVKDSSLRSPHAVRTIEFDSNNEAELDFGIVQPGSSFPLPLSIDPKQCWIRFKPVTDGVWTLTPRVSLGEMVEEKTSGKFDIRERCVTSDRTEVTDILPGGFLDTASTSIYEGEVDASALGGIRRSTIIDVLDSDHKPTGKTSETFFVRLRNRRNLLTVVVQTPLIITNLFPFRILINLKLESLSINWQEELLPYEAKPVAVDFGWSHTKLNVYMSIWIPGFGQSDFVPLALPSFGRKNSSHRSARELISHSTSGVSSSGMSIGGSSGSGSGSSSGGGSSGSGGGSSDEIKNTPQKIVIKHNTDERRRLNVYAASRAWDSFPFFKDSTGINAALNNVYLYTNYLFINKTNLDMEIRQGGVIKKDLTMKQTKITYEIFENQRLNTLKNEFIEPFLQNDPPPECDRLGRYKLKKTIMPPNDKWEWEDEDWIFENWEYSEDFNCAFHGNFDERKDQVRKRRIFRVMKPKGIRQLSHVTVFGGTNSSLTNRIRIRFVDRLVSTQWSKDIPLSEAVANDVMNLENPTDKKQFFEVSVTFELHRLYPSIKVIKFYPRYIALNYTSLFPVLYLRPAEDMKVKSKKRRLPKLRSRLPRRHSKAADTSHITSSTTTGTTSSMIARSKTSMTDRSGGGGTHSISGGGGRSRAHSAVLPGAAINDQSVEQSRSTSDDWSQVDSVATRRGYLSEACRDLPMVKQKMGAIREEMHVAQALHWFGTSQQCIAQLSVDGDQWTCGFPIHEISQFAIRVPTDGSVLRTQIRTSGQTTIVTFTQERRDYPFYQIFNATRWPLSYHQQPFSGGADSSSSLMEDSLVGGASGSGLARYTVQAGCAECFAWDDLSVDKKNRNLVVSIADSTNAATIPWDMRHSMMTCLTHEVSLVDCYLHVKNRGATKLLYVTEDQNPEERSDPMNVEINVNIAGLGLSVVDEVPTELMYIHSNQLNLKVEIMQNEQRLNFTMDSFQIDNQIPDSASPIMFCGLPKLRPSYLPWMSLRLVMYRQENSSSSKYVQELEVTPQVFYVQLDSQSVQEIVDFLSVLSSTSGAEYQPTAESADAENESSEPIYFGTLFIHPMEMYISYRQLGSLSGSSSSSSKQSSRLATTQESSWNNPHSLALHPLLRDGDSEEDGGSGYVQNFFFQFGVLVLNVPEAVVRVSGYAAQDRVFDTSMLGNVLGSHYKAQLVRGFLGLIGSLEIFGNVAGLANSVQSGIQDFFYEPGSGQDAKEVLKGFGTGTYSLLSKSFSGITTSVSSLTSAVGTGLSYLSTDAKYARERSIQRNASKPQSMSEAGTRGLTSLFKGVVKGVTGLVTHPVKGWKEEGVQGAALGVGQGVVGLIVKPVVGATDMISDVIYGAGVMLPKLHERKRTKLRNPRMFYGRDYLMKEYDARDAFIRINLAKLDYAHMSYEGSFAVPTTRRFCIILGEGLLETRLSKGKKGKLKFEDFYPWSVFSQINANKKSVVLKYDTKHTSFRAIASLHSSQSHSSALKHKIFDFENDLDASRIAVLLGDYIVSAPA